MGNYTFLKKNHLKCKWCKFNEEYLLIKEYQFWNLYLAESQSILGWCHAVLKRHIFFFEELTNEELQELKLIVSQWKFTLNQTFQPTWFNVMQLGNITPHLHFQLIPRYNQKMEYDKRTFLDKDFGKMIVDRWKREDRLFLEKLAKHLRKNIST